MFKAKGYRTETHEVQTEDGYILNLHRVPGKIDANIVTNPDVVSQAPEPRKPAVLFVHGLVCSADMWFTSTSADENLPYMLVNEGFDCWISNLRGTPHSKHISLKQNSRQYWDFSLDEIGQFDIPEMINYILATTGNVDLFYIGHSMGCASLFITLSRKPEYCKKIKLMVALAPSVYLKNVRNKLAKMIIYFSLFVGSFRTLYTRQSPLGYLVDVARRPFRNKEKIGIWMLKKIGPNFGAFMKNQMEECRLATICEVFPVSTSMKVFSHLSQFFRSGNFQQYNYGRSGNISKYGQQTPPIYDLKTIEIPVITFYSDADQLCHPNGMERIAQELPNVIEQHRISDPVFYHSDIVMGKDAAKVVFDKVVDILKNYRHQTIINLSSGPYAFVEHILKNMCMEVSLDVPNDSLKIVWEIW